MVDRKKSVIVGCEMVGIVLLVVKWERCGHCCNRISFVFSSVNLALENTILLDDLLQQFLLLLLVIVMIIIANYNGRCMMSRFFVLLIITLVLLALAATVVTRQGAKDIDLWSLRRLVVFVLAFLLLRFHFIFYIVTASIIFIFTIITITVAIAIFKVVELIVHVFLVLVVIIQIQTYFQLHSGDNDASFFVQSCVGLVLSAVGVVRKLVRRGVFFATTFANVHQIFEFLFFYFLLLLFFFFFLLFLQSPLFLLLPLQ
mmetsp:Transcript_29357/g.44797  ORF Transcript_29357/g.44797 Transcript_29357/m.44797 type:complete len:258 (+) Transcript_29357:328-1101(+)